MAQDPSAPLRVSVVINTYNRGASLRHTLRALRHQTYEHFEVIVVNGPSTDETADVLAEFDDVRVGSCPEAHLSLSRNVGIDLAAGDIVAFIDDDALPEPSWLAEIVAAYDGPRVGGAGGLVYDHTGFSYQYRYSACNRLGEVRFDLSPPLDEYLRPGAETIIYLQGTNCSFLRRALVEIGGFDEEIEYYMDEVDVCRRVIDLGYKVRPLEGAAVHHKYLASHRRNNKKVVLEPYPNVKNHCYLAALNNRERIPQEELWRILRKFADGVKAAGWAYFNSGKMTAAQRDHFLHSVERGLETGMQRGMFGTRKRREFPPADAARFRAYPTLRPTGKRLKVCFISQEYPPGDFGGIGRFTADLATGFAEAGHEVHVVTRSPDVNRVDLEDGVWLHRLTTPDRWIPEAEGVPLAGCLYNAAAAYHEVCRVHAAGAVDVVSAPLWACEGALCAHDGRFPTVLTLMTSMQTVAAMHPSWAGDECIRQVIALERHTARAARYLHPISAAILDKVRADHGDGGGQARVVPLGVRDRRDKYPRRRTEDGRVRILFVGRLERRKGVDVLLDAARELLRRYPEAEVVLAGKDTPNTETGTTYREAFERDSGTDPAVAGRLTFTGGVSEDELYQLYADADIVCLPSRYESFGLVLVEGMMFGKPVVGCAVGGMCEIVEVGKNGLLAEPGDAASLADCLGRLVGDPTTRAEFGRRSRELYEERYALPVVVENTVRWYSEVAAAPRGPAAGVDAVAGLITEATGLAPARASKVAAALLDAGAYPVDYLLAVRRLWHLPPAEFVNGLYNLLLNRDADAEGLAHYRERIESGMPRGEVIRALAQSAEMRQAGRPTAWLESLDAATGWRACLAGGPLGMARRARNLARRVVHKLFGPGLLGRIRSRVRALSPRAILRFAKRTVVMPRNVQTLAEGLKALQDQNQQVTDLAHAIAAQARGLQESYAVMAGMLRDFDADYREQAERLRQEVRQLKYCQADSYGTLAEEQRRQAAAVQALADALRPEGAVIPLQGTREVIPLAEGARILLDGERSGAGYVTVAPRPGPDVQVVAHAHSLPFAEGSLTEIDAGRLVDRFAAEHLESVLLPHWKRLLRTGGVLRVSCTDWDATVQALQRGELCAEEFTRALVTTPGPRAAWAPESLADLLRRHGFDGVTVVAVDRAAGAWREAEVVGTLGRPNRRVAV